MHFQRDHIRRHREARPIEPNTVTSTMIDHHGEMVEMRLASGVRVRICRARRQLVITPPPGCDAPQPSARCISAIWYVEAAKVGRHLDK